MDRLDPVSPQATEQPLMGVNGLDVAGLRPFDLVIPFTVKKGEITGETWPIPLSHQCPPHSQMQPDGL